MTNPPVCDSRDLFTRFAAVTPHLLLCAVDADGCFRYVNPALSAALGLPASELVGRTVIDVIHPDDVEYTRSCVERLSAGTPTITFKNRYRHAGGDYITLRWRSSREAETGLLLGAGRVLPARELERERLTRATLAVAATSLAIVSLDADGRIVVWNSAASDLFGYTEAEALQRSVFNLIPADCVEHENAVMRQVVSGELVSFETERLHKDGRRLRVSMTVYPETDETGRVVHTTAAVRDISHRVQQAEECDRLAERLRFATEAAGIGIWEWAPQTNRLVWDEQMYRLYGVLPQNCPGAYDAWQAGLHPDDAGRISEEIRRALNRDSAFDSVFRVIHPGGEVRHLRARAVVQRGDDGAPRRLIGTSQDITRRKAAESLLAQKNREVEASARLDRASSRLMVALNGQSEDGPTLLALQILSEETGCRPLALYTHDDWKGGLTRTAALGLPARSPSFYRLGQGLVGEAASRRTSLFLGGDAHGLQLDTGVGVLQMAEVFALPLVHRQRLVGVLTGATTKHLTDAERKWLGQIAAQLAAGLSALRQVQELRDLSTQLNERSRQLSEKNQELEQASRLNSEFLTSMSHELRTPLNSIIGFSDVLLDGFMGELDPQQLDYIDEIHTSGQQLLSLIDDILDLSKVEAGKMDLALEQITLKELIRGGLTVVRESAAQARVSLEHDIDPSCQTIIADPPKLKQILYNYLSNAVKFSPEGGIVRVEVLPTDDGVEIAVSDAGIGIAEADLPRLFKPFSQLESGNAQRTEGTGLGLSLVKSFAELHGGSVGVSSVRGKGSRFWVRLPHGGVPAPAPLLVETPAQVSPYQAMASPLLHLVEADQAAIDLTRGWLEQAGYRVSITRHPAQALEALSLSRPDAILLDINFSAGKEGWAFLGSLRGRAAALKIPVIMVSFDASAKRGFALGASTLLQKPVNGEELIAALRSSGAVTGQADRHLLVVDDDPRAVDFIARRLEREGVRVRRAYGGADALDMLQTEHFDAVILDLLMPEVSGFDVVRQMREDPVLAEIPVVVVTARHLDAHERQLLEQDVASVMTRGDWDEQHFLATVRAALQRVVHGDSSDDSGRPRIRAFQNGL